MIKRIFNLLFISFFVLISQVYANSQNNIADEIHGKDLSSYLYEYLINQGFEVQTQSLTKIKNNNFPYNIIVNIPKQNDTETNKSDFVENTDKIENVVFSFTQEYVYEYLDYILLLLNNFKNNKQPYNLVILMTADDEKLNIEGIKEVTGTNEYVKLNKDLDTYCTVVIKEQDKNDKYELIPGGNGDVSPSWLVKSVYKAFSINHLTLEYPFSFIFMYRNKLITDDERVAPFLSSGIPAVGISLNINESNICIFDTILAQLDLNITSSWDRHYLFLSNRNVNYIIGESVLIYIFLLFTLIVLFSLCFSTFSNKPKYIAIRKDIRRNWFFILVYLFLTTLFLEITQQFAIKISKSPLDMLSWKVWFAILFVTIIILIQIRYNIKISFQSMGYEILFTMAFNVFLFTSIDLSLMFFFFFEYLISFFFRKARKPISLVILFLVSCLPFFPYFITILNYTDMNLIYKIVDCGTQSNFIIALILLPVELQWTRIIIKFEIFTKDKKFCVKNLINSFIALFITALIILGLFHSTTTVLKTINKDNKTNDKKIILQEVYNSPIGINYELNEEEFMELKIKSITLKSDFNVVRYDIILESNKNTIIYDCNFDYEYITENSIELFIPNYPSSEVNILFTTDQDAINTIKVKTYKLNNANNYEVYSFSINY